MRSIAALKTHDPPPTALAGLAVTGARRYGKFIELSVPPLHLLVHLARAGWLRWREQPTQARPALRGPLAMVVAFRDGSTLEATEQGTEKRLSVYLVRDVGEVPGVSRLGVDALDEALTAEKLARLLSERAGTLKHVLADQEVIAGIGNAYSDEMLHAAKLSPFRHARSLQPDEVAGLHAAMRTVLSDALSRAMTLDTTELKRDKKAHMRVHGRTGETCAVCGATIREVSLASRSFQYCPGCQTGGRVYADRRMSRLLR
jgi:formamidopyrimidine-DNA glycosylase